MRKAVILRLGMRTKDQTAMFKTISSCFSGEDAVKWLVESGACDSKKDAVETARALQKKGFLRGATSTNVEKEFEDSRALYQFVPVVPQRLKVRDTLALCIREDVEIVDPPLIDGGTDFLVEPTVLSETATSRFFSTAREDAPAEINWYARMFVDREHDNYIGGHEALGGVVLVSVLVATSSWGKHYFVILWETKGLSRFCIDGDASSNFSLTAILERVQPAFAKHVKVFRSIGCDPSLQAELVRLEDPDSAPTFKMGVLYATHGQQDDNEMYGNVTGSAAFEEFLALLGERVQLKGLTGYVAQLDTQNNNSGLESVRTRHLGVEVMFHVSTLLRYDPNDEQCIQRKRFIGNDIVVVLFMEGTSTYNIANMKSHYTNILIVVQPHPSDASLYRVTSVAKKGVRVSGPTTHTYHKRDKAFINFLLTKCLNGERATKLAPEFAVREKRTRTQLYDDLYGRMVELPRVPPTDVRYSLASIPFNPVQCFKIEQVVADSPGHVRCIAHLDSRVYFATGSRIFVVQPGSEDITRLVFLDGIEQMIIAEEIGFMFVRTEKPRQLIVTYSLSDLTDGAAEARASPVPHTDNVSGMAFGVVEGVAYLAVVVQGAVVVLETDGRVYKEVTVVELPGYIESVAMTTSGVVVVVAADLELKVIFVSLVELEAKAAEIYSTSAPDRVHALVGLHDGILVAFASHGVVIAKGGLAPAVSLPWTAVPVHFLVVGPFLVISFAAFVEVRSLLNGAVIETHTGYASMELYTAFTCPSTRLSHAVFPTYKPSNNTTSLYRMVPRSPEVLPPQVSVSVADVVGSTRGTLTGGGETSSAGAGDGGGGSEGGGSSSSVRRSERIDTPTSALLKTFEDIPPASKRGSIGRVGGAGGGGGGGGGAGGAGGLGASPLGRKDKGEAGTEAASEGGGGSSGEGGGQGGEGNSGEDGAFRPPVVIPEATLTAARSAVALLASLQQQVDDLVTRMTTEENTPTGIAVLTKELLVPLKRVQQVATRSHPEEAQSLLSAATAVVSLIMTIKTFPDEVFSRDLTAVRALSADLVDKIVAKTNKVFASAIALPISPALGARSDKRSTAPSSSLARGTPSSPSEKRRSNQVDGGSPALGVTVEDPSTPAVNELRMAVTDAISTLRAYRGDMTGARPLFFELVKHVKALNVVVEETNPEYAQEMRSGVGALVAYSRGILAFPNSDFDHELTAFESIVLTGYF